MEDFFRGLIIAIFETTSISPEWLKFGTDTNAAAMQIVNSLWQYLTIIGISLTIIYFLIEINSKFAFEGANNMTLKSFFVPFLKLGVACVVLMYGAKITGYLLEVNDAMVDWASTNIEAETTEEVDEETGLSSGNQDIYEKITASFKDFNFACKLVLILVMLLMYFVSMLLSVVWVYKAYLYKLEVLYRVAITPVALADIYSGQHSQAIKWLKGFLGLALYAVAIIMISRISWMLVATGTDSDASTAGETIWNLVKTVACTFVAPFAALGVMGTIKQLCKEALG